MPDLGRYGEKLIIRASLATIDRILNNLSRQELVFRATPWKNWHLLCSSIVYSFHDCYLCVLKLRAWRCLKWWIWKLPDLDRLKQMEVQEEKQRKEAFDWLRLKRQQHEDGAIPLNLFLHSEVRNEKLVEFSGILPAIIYHLLRDHLRVSRYLLQDWHWNPIFISHFLLKIKVYSLFPRLSKKIQTIDDTPPFFA